MDKGDSLLAEIQIGNSYNLLKPKRLQEQCRHVTEDFGEPLKYTAHQKTTIGQNLIRYTTHLQ
jgi:hypothetical protein